jgi:hypothetical protein
MRRIDHQIDEEMIFRYEVSDEVVEAAAFVTLEDFQLLSATYCFACPCDPLRWSEQIELKAKSLT